MSRLGVRQPECLFLPYYPFSDGVIDKYALEFVLITHNIDKFSHKFNPTQKGADPVPSPFCRVPDLIEEYVQFGYCATKIYTAHRFVNESIEKRIDHCGKLYLRASPCCGDIDSKNPEPTIKLCRLDY